jgi:hypothetical protein
VFFTLRVFYCTVENRVGNDILIGVELCLAFNNEIALSRPDFSLVPS